MEFPIEVKNIECKSNQETFSKYYRAETGSFVKVKPCGKEYENKTFLGVLLGEFPLTISAKFNKVTGTLLLEKSMYNPAIFIPELKTVVFGCASWWGVISTPEQLKEISDSDIENVWYVKALRELEANQAEEQKPA